MQAFRQKRQVSQFKQLIYLVGGVVAVQQESAVVGEIPVAVTVYGQVSILSDLLCNEASCTQFLFLLYKDIFGC